MACAADCSRTALPHAAPERSGSRRQAASTTHKCQTWWTFRIFFIFFCLGEGKGESVAPGRGGGRVFYWNSQEGGGGVLPARGGGGWRGAGRVSAGNLGGGGAKYFFSGPKCPPSKAPAISRVAKALAIYRIEKPRNPEKKEKNRRQEKGKNRPKIGKQ